MSHDDSVFFLDTSVVKVIISPYLSIERAEIVSRDRSRKTLNFFPVEDGEKCRVPDKGRKFVSLGYVQVPPPTFTR